MKIQPTFLLIANLSIIFAFSSFSACYATELQSSDKPIIGINTDVDGDAPEESSVNSQYIEAVRNSGGIPILLPPMSAKDLACVMPQLDGVLMIGGADYPPPLYNQIAHPAISIMKKSRADFDMTFVKTTLADETLPFLGICAGCQALNIASGGTLTQDIPSQKPESKIKHSSPQGWQKGFNKHVVDINQGCKLANALGTTHLNVVSSHHQCVDKIGEGMVVTAKSEDGLVEAVERKGDRFVVGVQWHPERDFGNNQKIFEEFVRRAALHHKGRSQTKA